jgi:hypothetical protein
MEHAAFYLLNVRKTVVSLLPLEPYVTFGVAIDDVVESEPDGVASPLCL